MALSGEGMRKSWQAAGLMTTISLRASVRMTPSAMHSTIRSMRRRSAPTAAAMLRTAPAVWLARSARSRASFCWKAPQREAKSTMTPAARPSTDNGAEICSVRTATWSPGCLARWPVTRTTSRSSLGWPPESSRQAVRVRSLAASSELSAASVWQCTCSVAGRVGSSEMSAAARSKGTTRENSSMTRPMIVS